MYFEYLIQWNVVQQLTNTPRPLITRPLRDRGTRFFDQPKLQKGKHKLKIVFFFTKV